MSCHSRSIAINAAIVIDNEIFFNILCFGLVILTNLYLFCTCLQYKQSICGILVFSMRISMKAMFNNTHLNQ